MSSRTFLGWHLYSMILWEFSSNSIKWSDLQMKAIQLSWERGFCFSWRVSVKPAGAADATAWLESPQLLTVEQINAVGALQSLLKPRLHQFPRMSDLVWLSEISAQVPLTLHICPNTRARGTLYVMQSQESVQHSSNSESTVRTMWNKRNLLSTKAELKFSVCWKYIWKMKSFHMALFSSV